MQSASQGVDTYLSSNRKFFPIWNVVHRKPLQLGIVVRVVWVDRPERGHLVRIVNTDIDRREFNVLIAQLTNKPYNLADDWVELRRWWLELVFVSSLQFVIRWWLECDSQVTVLVLSSFMLCILAEMPDTSFQIRHRCRGWL